MKKGNHALRSPKPPPDRKWLDRMRAAAKHQGHEDESLLFVRPDSYGDLILFEPVLRWFRSNWPATRLGVLARKAVGDIAPLLPDGVDWLLVDADPLHAPLESVEAHPEVGRLVRNFDPAVLVAAAFGKTWLEVLAALAAPDRRQVRLGPLHLELSIELALRRAGQPFPPGFFPEVVEMGSEIPETEKNHRLLEALAGTPVARSDPRIEIPRGAQLEADRALAALGLGDGNFIVCCPGGIANVVLKSWPIAAFVETLRAVIAEVPVGILIMGHESEHGILLEAQEALRDLPVPVHAYPGRTGTLPISGGILRRSRAYLGNDTGNMHLAAALGRPTAGIFGGGTWPRFRPAGTHSIAIVNPIPCFGCGWDCHFDAALCLHAIRPQDVARTFVRLLRKDPGAREPVMLQNVPETYFPAIAGSRKKYELLQQEKRSHLRQICELAEYSTRRENELSGQLRTALATQSSLHEALGGQAQIVEQLNATAQDRELRLQLLDSDLAQVNQLARQQMDALAAQHDRAQQEVQALAGVVAEREARLAALDADLVHASQMARRQIDELIAQRDFSLQERQALALAVALREEKLAVLDADLAHLNKLARQQIDELSAQRDRAHQQVETLTHLVAQRDERLAALDADLTHMNTLARQQIDDLSAQRDRAHQQVETLTHLVAQRDERLIAIDGDLTRVNQLARQQVDELTAKLGAAEHEIRGLARAVSQCNEKIAALDADLVRVNQMARREINEVIAQRNDAQQHLVDFTQVVGERDQQLAAMNADLIRVNQLAHEQHQHHLNLVERLQRENAEAGILIRDREQRLEGLAHDIQSDRQRARQEAEQSALAIAEAQRKLVSCDDFLRQRDEKLQQLEADRARVEMTLRQEISKLAACCDTQRRAWEALLAARWTRIGVALRAVEPKLSTLR